MTQESFFSSDNNFNHTNKSSQAILIKIVIIHLQTNSSKHIRLLQILQQDGIVQCACPKLLLLNSSSLGYLKMSSQLKIKVFHRNSITPHQKNIKKHASKSHRDIKSDNNGISPKPIQHKICK